MSGSQPIPSDAEALVKKLSKRLSDIVVSLTNEIVEVAKTIEHYKSGTAAVNLIQVCAEIAHVEKVCVKALHHDITCTQGQLIQTGLDASYDCLPLRPRKENSEAQ